MDHGLPGFSGSLDDTVGPGDYNPQVRLTLARLDMRSLAL